MVPQIVKIECIVVNSEVEALILENELIKKHKPKYNILLKDDKKNSEEEVVIPQRSVPDDSEYSFRSQNVEEDTDDIIPSFLRRRGNF